LICVNNGGAAPSILRIQEKAAFETGLDIMPSGNRYWLEYDSVALAVLLMGIGLVGLIVLII